MGEFAGWSMPLEYAGGGVTVEHLAVREAVGLFDVSHLGTIEVAGPDALARLNALFTNDLDRIGDGAAQYTLLCNDDGGTVDDLIVYRRSADAAVVIPNAANAGAVLTSVRRAVGPHVDVVDRHRTTAVIAIQGPASDALLTRLELDAALPYMAFVDTVVPAPDAPGGSVPVVLCRSGYTGERGVELLVAADAAPQVWQVVMAAGSDLGIRPCGLVSRDTLRTEMGYPLHGHELSPSIGPVEARLSWAVGWDKPEFAGRAALMAQREAGPKRVLRALVAEGRGVPRPGMTVRALDGTPLGALTSGTYSPSLGTGIGLALLAASVEVGADVVIDVRGRDLPARVVPPPLVGSSPR